MTGLKEKDLNIRQIPFRLHQNDKALFYKLLRDKGMNFQKFSEACMQALINQDPAASKIIKDWKDLNELPKRSKLMGFSLSDREKAKIQEELELLHSQKGLENNECIDGQEGEE